MKECEHISGLFGEFHDRHADAGTEKLLRDHLVSCTSCREDFKWYGFTVQALERLEEIPPPGDFLIQLNKKLDGTEGSSFVPFLSSLKSFFTASPYLPLPVGLATLGLIAVVGFVMYNNNTVTEFGQTTAFSQSHQPPIAGAMVAKGEPRAMRPAESPLNRAVLPSPGSSFAPSSSLNVPRKLAANPKSPSQITPANRRFFTVVDKIGGDNLTVESPSIDQAVASVKSILPGLDGRLIEEKTPGKVGEKILGVLIPSGAFSNLTSELINHGAVAVGLGPEAGAPAPSKSGPDNVMLYIRFVQSKE